MHWSIAVLTFLGLTNSAFAGEGKPEIKQFQPCTNFGEEWCSDGEILTCHQAAPDHGWAKSIHKTCSTKREVGKSDKCFNYGQEWCSNGEILTCKKILDVDQGRAITTNKQCGVEKRGVGSWCEDHGATWCQDYKMLHCENNRVANTGAGCDNSHNLPGDNHGPGPVTPLPWTNNTMKHHPHPRPHKNETDDGNEKRHGGPGYPWWNHNGTHPGPGKHRPHKNETHEGPEKRHEGGNPWWRHPRPHKNETEGGHEKRHGGGEFGPPWWKHNSTHPGPDKHRPHRNETHEHGRDQDHDDEHEKRHGGGHPWWQHPRPHKNETQDGQDGHEKRHGNGEFGLPWWKHNGTHPGPGPEKGHKPSWNGTHPHDQDHGHDHDDGHNEHEPRDHGHEWGPLGDDGQE